MLKLLTAALLSMGATFILSTVNIALAETNAETSFSKGSNKAAILSFADVVLTENNAPLKAQGRLTIKDVDSSQTFVVQRIIGNYGTFKINKYGAWNYVTHSALNELKEGQSVNDQFTVSSADGTTTTVKVTINGSNDPAILSAANVVLNETNEPLSTGGKLTIQDVDSPETFVAQSNVAGSNGVFSIDAAGVWSYVANSAFDYLKVGQSISDKFTVSSADGTATTVKVTINGTNDPAILSAADVELTETNEVLSTKGTLTIKDIDSPETFVAQKKVGKYGTLNIDSVGAWNYVTKSALDELNVGRNGTDIFTVSSADGTTTTVKVTINGTNDPAILSAANIVLTETNEPLKAQGRLTIKDVDSSQTFVVQRIIGNYGTFKINKYGAWNYVTHSALNELKEGQSVNDQFTVSSADGTTTTVKVTINGSNDPAILSAANVVLNETNEPLSTGGKLTIQDVDSPETFVAQSNVAGSNGVFSIDAAGVWSYVANSAFDYLKVGQSISDKFTVSSADGTATTVKVTINGTNDPAILSAADVELTETNEVLSTKGTLTIKDIDSPETFVAQKKVGKYGTLNIDSVGAWNYVTKSALDELNVGRNGTDIFTVSSADGTTTTVKVTINGTNDPAILSAENIAMTETNVPLRFNGKLINSDVDDPETFVPQSKVDGVYGTFSIDNLGVWTYIANSAFDELNVGESLKDGFTVTSADGTATKVQVTINGTNDPAILSVADIELTETNQPLSTGGKLTILDVDSPQTYIAQSNVTGTNGVFNIDAAGVWTYSTNSALDELNVGRSAADIFTVSSADGTTTTVRITVNGTNDPAILSSEDIPMDETNDPLNTSGKLTISDVDDPETFVTQTNASRANGIFSIEPTGEWTYTSNDAFDYLNIGDVLSGNIPVISSDGTPTSVKITINGTNDPAILSAADISLDETNAPLKTSGNLTIYDVDSAKTFVAQKKVAGKNGTFNIDTAGAWTYVAKSAFDYLNIGDKLSDSFTISSADGTTTTVKVTINGTNDPAILSSANVHLDEIFVPQHAKGKLTIKDVDNPEIFKEQTDFAGTTGIFNIDKTGAWTYLANSNFEELNKGESVSDTFIVTSSDGTTTTVKITIHGTEPSEFRGRYIGGKIGIVKSSASDTSGKASAPSAATLAYGLQGGYLQAGYNWDMNDFVFGVGVYGDWNTYAIHSNDIAYASRGFGFDTKLGLPVGKTMPYVKLGYGYSTGTRDPILRAVAQNSTNQAIGIEVNLAPRWSAIAEYKIDSFSNANGSIKIKNRIFSFGLNYYFDIPIPIKVVAEDIEPDYVMPDAIVDPNSAPAAPPEP